MRRNCIKKENLILTRGVVLGKETAVIAQRFRNFAKNECKCSSELYEFLSNQIAGDNGLLKLCAYTRTGQPIPNLLFGAIHYLLLRGTNHRLSEYYPSIVKEPKDIKGSFIPLKTFVRSIKLKYVRFYKTS